MFFLLEKMTTENDTETCMTPKKEGGNELPLSEVHELDPTLFCLFKDSAQFL